MSASARLPELFGAIQFFAKNHLQLSGIVSARIGLGVRELSSLKGYTKSVVLLWRPNSTYARIIELDCANGHTDRLRLAHEHDDWTQLRLLQLFMSDDYVGDHDAAAGTRTTSSGGQGASSSSSSGGDLSTIPEETEPSTSDASRS